jgi:hypothetical protein
VKKKREAEIERQADEVADVVASDGLVAQLRDLIAEARSIGKQARRSRNLSVAMTGIDRQARVLEPIAKLTGQLDESTRVNVLIAQREEREKAQVMQLQRLTLDERVELARLLKKAGNDADQMSE